MFTELDLFFQLTLRCYVLISFFFQAIFVLLDSEDPLFACLEKKEAFLDSLFSWISCKVANVLSTTNDFPLEGFPSGTLVHFILFHNNRDLLSQFGQLRYH